MARKVRKDRRPRPICPVCGVREVKIPWKQQTCGKSCAAIRRGAEFDAARRKASERSQVTRHGQYIGRLKDTLVRELDPALPADLPNRPAALKALVLAAARLVKQARTTERARCYDRYVLQPRVQALRALKVPA